MSLMGGGYGMTWLSWGGVLFFGYISGIGCFGQNS